MCGSCMYVHTYLSTYQNDFPDVVFFLGSWDNSHFKLDQRGAIGPGGGLHRYLPTVRNSHICTVLYRWNGQGACYSTYDSLIQAPFGQQYIYILHIQIKAVKSFRPIASFFCNFSSATYLLYIRNNIFLPANLI